MDEKLRERAYYDLSFRVKYFIDCQGEAFQNFFADIMGRRYPGDYIRTITWGYYGDLKNDGYLTSRRMLFQIYAPNEMSANDCIAKMNSDFHGAVKNWGRHFSTWVFVHNSHRKGLGAPHELRLLELAEYYEDITAIEWGYEALRKEFFELDEIEWSLILGMGTAPALYDMDAIRFSHLEVVLTGIALMPPRLDQDLRPFELEEKLSINNLSENSALLLKEGLKKSHLVGLYFRKHSDPTLGEYWAETFKRTYQELRYLDVDPDIIFAKLYAFLGGTKTKDKDVEGAILAVLAYFFENCDIFESPLREALL